jgi:hypothetical protein
MILRINAKSEEDLKNIIVDINSYFKSIPGFKSEFTTEDKVFLDADKNKVTKKITLIKVEDQNNGKETTIKFIPFIDTKQTKVELGGDNLVTIKGKIKNQLKGRGTLHLYSKDKKVKLDEIKRLQKLAGL